MRRLTDGLRRRHDGELTQELVRHPGGFGLGQVPARLVPDATTAMVCGFCSIGCSLDVHLRKGEAINLTPSANYPVNRGMACPKGWESLAPLRADDRATTPLLRNQGGQLAPVSWAEAVATFAGRMAQVQATHGPDSVAFLSTGQIATEEMALLGAVAKFGMGFIHGDGNTRQCMATSVTAYKQSFGFDAPPYTYADLEESDVIVLAGSNLCIAHPILWERICRNPHAPEIVVVDPRATETALAATRHVALAPKSDLVLWYGVARLLMARGWIDQAYIDDHTTGYAEFAAHVEEYTLARVAAATGLAEAEIEGLAELIHGGRRVSFWWTMGVNQSHEGVAAAQALINLALMTGNIGRPGTGANSITGQCNAMGSRLFSNTASLFAGRDFTSAADRAEVATALGIDPGAVPQKPSLAYDQILDGVRDGNIRGLWIIATNTAHSWIDSPAARAALADLDFLVVQDLYPTSETARLADLVLPAAGWGEKEGTFINSERRIGLIKQVARAPGQALADFNIFKLVAEAWGCGSMFEEWSSPEAVFAILQRLSAGRPCDITGIEGYDMIERCGGVQWPWPAEGSAGTEPAPERRLFADGAFYHPDGRARMRWAQPRPPGEQTSAAFPFVLLTGRGSSSQWHTQTRTAKSAVLRALAPETVYLELHPADAAAKNIETGEWVVVRSARSQMRARARVTPTIRPGQVFLPMHYAETNLLTFAEVDPQSRQPSYKYAAVALDRG